MTLNPFRSRFALALPIGFVSAAFLALTSEAVAQPASAVTAPAPESLAPEKLEKLTRTVRSWVDAGELVGAEVLIAQNGQVAFHDTVGWSDREANRPMKKGSLFNVASMAKPVLGTAILMLVEGGSLSLDAEVADYLPSFRNDRSQDITVRHLLTHTAGYDWWGPFNRRTDVAGQPSLRAAVDVAGAAGPQAPVGEHYAYSNMSTMVLAALVAEVSGKPAEQFIQERIFKPLGMTNTHPTFSPAASWAHRVNPIYCWDRESSQFVACWDPAEEPRVPYFRGSGGLRTTAEDYLRFMTLWMNKGRFGNVRLLSEATVEQALRPYAGRVYGFHWQVPEAVRVEGLPTVFGHGGADGTVAAAFPATGTVILYFTQSGEGTPTPASVRFFELVHELGLLDHPGPYQLDAIRPSNIDALQLSAEAIVSYVGIYRTTDRGGGTLRVVEEDGHLSAEFESDEEAWSEPLVHTGSDTFARGTFSRGRPVEFFPRNTYVFTREEHEVEGVELRSNGELVFSFQREI